MIKACSAVVISKLAALCEATPKLNTLSVLGRMVTVPEPALIEPAREKEYGVRLIALLVVVIDRDALIVKLPVPCVAKVIPLVPITF